MKQQTVKVERCYIKNLAPQEQDDSLFETLIDLYATEKKFIKVKDTFMVDLPTVKAEQLKLLLEQKKLLHSFVTDPKQS